MADQTEQMNMLLDPNCSYAVKRWRCLVTKLMEKQ
jgi:hypothetical protein